MLEKLFHLKEHGTDVRTEVIAGITTFMTMAYILAVNPNILAEAGMDRGAVFTATALAAFIATSLMAMWSNYPFVLAPGMGLNAYFAYTVVIGMGYTWKMALAAVFVEGIVFILLSLINVREAIFNAIPMNLKHAVSVGIGLFIAFIGLQNAKIVVDSSTLVGIFSFKDSLEKETFFFRRNHGLVSADWDSNYGSAACEKCKREYFMGDSDYMGTGNSLSADRNLSDYTGCGIL